MLLLRVHIACIACKSCHAVGFTGAGIQDFRARGASSQEQRVVLDSCNQKILSFSRGVHNNTPVWATRQITTETPGKASEDFQRQSVTGSTSF